MCIHVHGVFVKFYLASADTISRGLEPPSMDRSLPGPEKARNIEHILLVSIIQESISFFWTDGGYDVLQFISKSSSIRTMMLKMMILIFVATTCALSILLYFEARSYAIQEAEKKIKNLLLEHQALHEYIGKHQKPEITKLKQEGKLDKNYFSPEILSSSYITKYMHQYYNEQRRKKWPLGILLQACCQ